MGTPSPTMAWHRANAQQQGQRLQGPGGRCSLRGQHAFGVAVRIRTVGQAELQHLTQKRWIFPDFMGRIWDNGGLFNFCLGILGSKQGL